MSVDHYDEFSYFHENLSEWNLDVALPHVQRFFVAVDGLRQLSGLKWGDSTPQLAMLHGGAQNAHTFDTVALAMQRPLVALDLPGHGHSDPSPYGSSSTVSHAIDVARALEQLLDGPRPLVGMSMGGLTAIMVAHARRDLVASLVLIDITPGVNAAKAQHVTNFINGPASFDDFDALLERTVAHNPTRSVSSLRRGIRHNALQRSDGTWVWRHQQHPSPQLVAPPVGDLWQMLEELTVSVTLLRGMAVGSVVDDEDEAELLRRCPQATIVHVEGAGHSIQGDAPVEMATLLNRFCVQ
jgi:pimeloyl-ACP methyl ester carboxylesterase